MSEYTPPLARLRDEYVEMRTEHFGFSDLYAAEFDRALQAHDRQVAAKAVDAALDHVQELRGGDIEQEYIDAARAASLVPGNPEPGERQCSECSSSLARCENAKSDGYIKCCPDCRHPEPTEGENRG